MHNSSSKWLEWPFHGQSEEREDEVDDLQNWEGLHCSIKSLGEEVPENLRPEETFDGGFELVCDCMLARGRFAEETGLRTGCCGKNDESCPVILDEFSHVDDV